MWNNLSSFDQKNHQLFEIPMQLQIDFGRFASSLLTVLQMTCRSDRYLSAERYGMQWCHKRVLDDWYQHKWSNRAQNRNLDFHFISSPVLELVFLLTCFFRVRFSQTFKHAVYFWRPSEKRWPSKFTARFARFLINCLYFVFLVMPLSSEPC